MSTVVISKNPPGVGQPWIVSAGWDLAYVVVTPILIVPIVLILVRQWLTPEQVSLAVISFASLGHHLPGFMRAYGDRELFWRYPWRFLLIPPLVFAIALCFTPPEWLANWLGIPWVHFHGLELVLLVWGTWHGLMQTYGFMRIYDIKRGVNEPWSTRLDHWLCLVVFLTGVVFSDARVFAIADAMWQSGLPLFGPQWIERLRTVVGIAGLLVAVMYAANLVRQSRAGLPVSGIKLLLIASTGWFYCYTGRLSVNLLIGIAMFEIYHAVQYCAIVWIYNRRLFRKAGDCFGPLGFMFRDSWTMLGLYLAAIGAYSSIRYFTMDGNTYIFSGGGEDAYQWLLALFVTSAFLHFYFDGFIWKVSEPKTQENLTDSPLQSASPTLRASGLVHASKWAVLLAVIAFLLLLEKRHLGEDESHDYRRLAALVALTPNLPECQSLLCRDALERGDAVSAVQFGERAVQLRSRSATVHADLGLAYLMAGRLVDARNQFQRAVEIAPRDWSHHCDLAAVLAKLNDANAAERELRLAAKLSPAQSEPLEQLAEIYLAQNRMTEAYKLYATIAQRFPSTLTGELGRIMLLNRSGKHTEAIKLASFLAAGNSDNWRVLLALGSSLNAAGEAEQAAVALQRAAMLRPNSAEVHFQLGLAQFQARSYVPALLSLSRAIKFDPRHFNAHLQLGSTYYVVGEVDAALGAFQKALDLKPGDATASANYGGLLAQLGMPEEAEKIYRSGLAVNKDSGQLHYNLGVLLWQQGEKDEAIKLLENAKLLGVQLPTEVKAAVQDVSFSSDAGKVIKE